MSIIDWTLGKFGYKRAPISLTLRHHVNGRIMVTKGRPRLYVVPLDFEGDSYLDLVVRGRTWWRR